MKKIIALSAVLFLAFSVTTFAQAGGGKGKPEQQVEAGKDKPAVGTAGKDKPVATDGTDKGKGKTKDKIKGHVKNKANDGGKGKDKDKGKDKPSKPNHGLKKGWTKNTHNPHHPNSDNPGHAKKKQK